MHIQFNKILTNSLYVKRQQILQRLDKIREEQIDIVNRLKKQLNEILDNGLLNEQEKISLIGKIESIIGAKDEQSKRIREQK